MEQLMEGLDDEARRVLQQAQEAAVSAGHSYVATEHLLFGLVADEVSTASLLQGLGGEPEQLRRPARQRLRPNPKREGDPIPTEDLLAVVTAAQGYAARFAHDQVYPEHLLLGLADSIGRGCLRMAGLDVDRVWDAALTMLGVPAEQRFERPSKQEEANRAFMPPELRQLRRVIPIAQTRSAPDGALSVTLISIEDYADGFRLRGTFQVQDPPDEGGVWPGGAWYHPTLMMDLVDDLGSQHRQRGPEGGGSKWRWTFNHSYTPALPATAEYLRLSIRELRWDRSDRDTGVTDLHRRDPLGWSFTIPLAGREHLEL